MICPCKNCGCDALKTWRCHCCSNAVCQTCMQELDACCIECQIVFPVAVPAYTRAAAHNLALSSQTQAHIDASSRGFSPCPSPLPIIDRASSGESQKGNALSQQMQHITNVEPRVVDMLKACLQQVGVAPSQCDHVIQNIHKDFADVISNSDKTVKDNASRCGVDIKLKASKEKKARKADKNGKRMVEGRTMMVCNIPCRVRHEDLVEAIESTGFGGTYEFVHIPGRKEQRDSNLGYGFIHFSHCEDAEKFAYTFEGYRFSGKASSKTCTVKVATCQGTIGKLRK
mmetsp:Transcript_106107/g.167487  ORF Transcript_106107/g.167487 Transcript_106107/m.167487 type:complete len:285 (+) Transcript_106107:1-855(+)